MIPIKIRKELNEDDFMKVCCFPDCGCALVQFHHCFIYSGRQIQERALIVPACKEHHDEAKGGKFELDKGDKFIKDYFQYIALNRSDINYLKAKYPKYPWEFELARLNKIFDGGQYEY